MATLTIAEFDTMVSEFLETIDDIDYDEWYATHHTFAHDVLEDLRTHLYGDNIGRDARRELYEKLKQEFDTP